MHDKTYLLFRAVFILKCSRYSETTLNYYNELPCPVSRSTPRCKYIFLDIPWKSLCTVSVYSDAQDIYKLYLAVTPSQIRSCARDKLRHLLRTRQRIQRGPNIIYRLPLLPPERLENNHASARLCYLYNSSQ